MKGLPPEPISSWVRFECSFGAKFENGYARNKAGANYARMCKNLAKKQHPLLQGVDLVNCSYDKLSFLGKQSLIYCDPPYQGTTGYKTGSFNHEVFFDWCVQKKKEGHVVFVSEYNAPFECVWEGEIKTNFASSRKEATHVAVEKLFLV
jgi:DNA adenine methylase